MTLLEKWSARSGAKMLPPVSIQFRDDVAGAVAEIQRNFGLSRQQVVNDLLVEAISLYKKDITAK